MKDQRPVAVVTGGARGIGAACARELALRNLRIVIIDVEETLARTLAAEIGGAALTADVSDAAAVEALAETIEREYGPVTALAHSAGIIQVPLPPEELTMQAWDDVLRVDLRGAYVTCAAFGRRMALRRRGAIVNIASIAGMRSMPLHAYAPAKAAVIAMTECLAAEWGPRGVRVNALSPGYTLTPAVEAAIKKGQRNPALLEASSALGRLVQPKEIAKAVAFLLSDDASAITGINLPVDAGHLVAGSWQAYGGLRGR